MLAWRYTINEYKNKLYKTNLNNSNLLNSSLNCLANNLKIKNQNLLSYILKLFIILKIISQKNNPAILQIKS